MKQGALWEPGYKHTEDDQDGSYDGHYQARHGEGPHRELKVCRDRKNYVSGLKQNKKNEHIAWVKKNTIISIGFKVAVYEKAMFLHFYLFSALISIFSSLPLSSYSILFFFWTFNSNFYLVKK